MTYFYVLVFTYYLQGEEVNGGLFFENETQCEAALRASDNLYEHVRSLSRDSMVSCVETTIPSGYTIRPRSREDAGRS